MADTYPTFDKMQYTFQNAQTNQQQIAKIDVIKICPSGIHKFARFALQLACSPPPPLSSWQPTNRLTSIKSDERRRVFGQVRLTSLI